MNFKLARTSLNEKAKIISLEKIEEAVVKEGQKFFYLDQDNQSKDLTKLAKHFAKINLSVYYKTVKYGLDEQDFVYEVYIL